MLYQFCHLINLSSSYQTCYLLTLCYLLAFYFSYAPYKCTCYTHHKHNFLSCLIVRTLSAPICLSNSPGVFGHRAILICGDRDMAGGCLEALSHTRKSRKSHFFKRSVNARESDLVLNQTSKVGCQEQHATPDTWEGNLITTRGT